MEKITCNVCKGAKQISMGFTFRDCPKCEGEGHVFMTSTEEKADSNVEVKKRMGRPPKNKDA